MFGKTSRHQVPYCCCQPRGRLLPDGHPAAVHVREDVLLTAVTEFFNAHVLGPARGDLAKASLPAAHHHVRQGWQHKTEMIRRQIAEVDQAMDNLARALERESDHDGLLYERVHKRMTELDGQLAQLQRQLGTHLAAQPPTPTDDISLLDQLPVQAVDLKQLATDRLRRFLDAFQIEIHYDHRTHRATLRATISGDTIGQLTRVVRHAARPATEQPPAQRKPAHESQAETIKGSSSVWRPR
jgi:site-specific DNA recombinase